LGSLGDDILGSLAIFGLIWRLSAFAEAGLPIITVRWSVPLRGFRGGKPASEVSGVYGGKAAGLSVQAGENRNSEPERRLLGFRRIRS